MKLKRYHLSYAACGLSVFAAFVSALVHSLPFLLINLFFAIWNYYMAEHLVYLESLEDQPNEESNDENGHE